MMRTLLILAPLALLNALAFLASGAEPGTNAPAPETVGTVATPAHSSPAPATHRDPASSPGTSTSSPGSANQSGLEAFRIISERNIFNPNRSGRNQEREVTRREPERRGRMETIVLVGTMAYARGAFAFFDGSDSNYRRTLKSSESIAGFTVDKITSQQVTLRPESTNEHEITLPLGMQLQRHDGKWELAARTDTGSAAPAGSATASVSPAQAEVLKRLAAMREQEGGATNATVEPEPPAESTDKPASISPSNGPADEVLRKLMQRRQQENDK